MAHDPVQDKELLQLVRAFCVIKDTDARRIIIAIAQATAGGLPVIVDEADAKHDVGDSWLAPFLARSQS